MFLYTSPGGNHEPPFPGQHVDLAEEYSNLNLPDEDCAAYAERSFDTGTFLVNMLMRAATSGKVETDHCLARNDCDSTSASRWVTPPPPPERVCDPNCE